MPKTRFFIMIMFSDNNILIDYLSLIAAKLGKYDFFSQNIKCPYGISGKFSSDSNYKIKIISFKKLYPINKCETLLKRSAEIQKKMANAGHMDFQLTVGYLTKDQVVTVYDAPAMELVYMKENLYAQIQLFYMNGRMNQARQDNGVFSLPDIKKYFGDLHSLYREQILK